jgi:hypothetical protein
MAVRVIRKAPASMILEDQSMPEKTVKVRVSDRWRVVHEDKPYIKGDELTVPEDVAQEWERNGYVEKVTSKKAE